VGFVGIVAPELLAIDGLDRFTGLSTLPHHPALYNRLSAPTCR
jgi:hypothetical protein